MKIRILENYDDLKIGDIFEALKSPVEDKYFIFDNNGSSWSLNKGIIPRFEEIEINPIEPKEFTKHEFDDFTKQLFERQISIEHKIDHILKRMNDWGTVNEASEYIQSKNIENLRFKDATKRIDSFQHQLGYSLTSFDKMMKKMTTHKLSIGKKKVLKKRKLKDE